MQVVALLRGVSPSELPCAHVPADPPPQLVPAPNVTVSPGETAILSCRVLGEAPYNLTWVRDWRVLPASTGRITQLDDLSLEVSAIVPSDGGRYQCIASNANGAARASVWLLVRGEALPAMAVLPIPHTIQCLPQKSNHPSIPLPRHHLWQAMSALSVFRTFRERGA